MSLKERLSYLFHMSVISWLAAMVMDALGLSFNMYKKIRLLEMSFIVFHALKTKLWLVKKPLCWNKC